MNERPSDPDSNEPMTDELLSMLLRTALDHAEPVPAAAVDAAYAAFDMSALSEELAILAFDSLVVGAAVETRATESEVRLLSFVNDHLTVDLELHADGRTIVGQLSPPTGSEVEAFQLLQAETADGTVIDVPTDEFGRFRVTVPVGAVRLRATGLLITPWITR
jgi:hypothetical protein